MHPIDTLKTEHRLIEKVIAALEGYVRHVEAGEDAPREDLAGFAGFIREFADTCHHGKEEDILFATMNENGMPAEAGPIAVMLHEHTIGRDYAGRLAALGTGDAPFTDEEKAELARAARGYAHLLRDHIMKEDNILYPMATNLLSADVMDEMAGRFEAFEKDEMGDGTHERFHAAADALIGKYAA